MVVAAHVGVTAAAKVCSDGMLEHQVVVAELAKPTDRSLQTGNTTAVGMVWQKRVPEVAATGLGFYLADNLLANVIAFHKSETGTIRERFWKIAHIHDGVLRVSTAGQALDASPMLYSGKSNLRGFRSDTVEMP